MALNNFSASFISRSAKSRSPRKTGQNAIAHAAYCRREKLIDERTGKTYDGLKMGKGQEAEWKAIYIPSHAQERLRDPEKLWNEVEKREDQSLKRDTALLSRSWIHTFPKQLNREQRINMAKDFMREVAREGWIIDGAIHSPDGDNQNWHMHSHLPMRYVTKEGFGKRRKLSDEDRKITREDELVHWKSRWSELGAKQLKRAGYEQEAERFREGHKTLKEQRMAALKRGDLGWADKMDREPQVHMGPVAWAMEKAGKRTRQGDKNREIFARNQERTQKREKERSRGRTVGGGRKVAGGLERTIGGLASGVANALDSLLGPGMTEEDRERAKGERLLRDQEETHRARERERDR